MSNKTIVTVFMNIIMYAVVIINSYRTAVDIINSYRTIFSSKADSLQKYIYSTVISKFILLVKSLDNTNLLQTN